MMEKRNNNRKRNITRSIKAMVLAFLCLLLQTVPMRVYAAEGQNTTAVVLDDAMQGVIQIVVMYVDDDGGEHLLQGGSGFLIGDEDEALYVVTAKEVTTISEEQQQKLRKTYALEEDESLSFQTKVVANRDVLVTAQLIAESEEMDFSVWKLSQPLYDRKPLVLCAINRGVYAGKQAWVAGFSKATELTGTAAEKSSMTLIGDDKEKGIGYLHHNMTPVSGIVGGPVLNTEGEVIGLFQNKTASNGYYSLQISEVIAVLITLGIPYTTASEVMASQGGFINAITVFFHGLPQWAIVLLIEAAVCLIVLIVFFIKCKFLPRHKEKKQKKEAEFIVTEPAPVFDESATPARTDYRQLVQQTGQTATTTISSKAAVSREETKMTQNQYGGTTVFVPEQEQAASGNAFLVRKRTGERIEIKGAEFVIGKDPSQTDYYITGNSAISRVHAVIICKGKQYDVADKNATNGTFVNDVKVSAYQRMQLHEGDVLRLADEDLEFHLGKAGAGL